MERNKKLPVFAIILQTIKTVRRNARRLSKCLLVPAMLLLAFDFVDQNFVSDSSLAYFISFAVYGCIFTLFAVTCHRVILLGSESVPKYGVLTWSSREWLFLWWTMVTFTPLLVLVFVFSPLLSYFEMGFRVSIVMHVLGVLSVFYVIARLSLFLPAAAIEQKSNWHWVLDISKNNGWRLVVIAGLFPTVLNIIPSLWFDGDIISGVVLSLLEVILLVLEISALSLAYKYLSELFQEEQII